MDRETKGFLCFLGIVFGFFLLATVIDGIIAIEKKKIEANTACPCPTSKESKK